MKRALYQAYQVQLDGHKIEVKRYADSRTYSIYIDGRVHEGGFFDFDSARAVVEQWERNIEQMKGIFE